VYRKLKKPHKKILTKKEGDTMLNRILSADFSNAEEKTIVQRKVNKIYNE
jgi:hypothetical protein